MSYWVILVIVAPFLFLLGTILNALKEQKKFEQGPLQEILKKRHQERQEFLKKHGCLPKEPSNDAHYKKNDPHMSCPSSKDSKR